MTIFKNSSSANATVAAVDMVGTPAGWRRAIPEIPSILRFRRVYQLADGTLLRVDDTGHLGMVVQGGAPGWRSIASDPAPGRRP